MKKTKRQVIVESDQAFVMPDRMNKKEKKEFLKKLEPFVKEHIGLLRDRGSYNFEELSSKTGIARTHISSLHHGHAPLRETYLSAFIAAGVLKVSDLITQVMTLTPRECALLRTYQILAHDRIVEMLVTLIEREVNLEQVLEMVMIERKIPLPQNYW